MGPVRRTGGLLVFIFAALGAIAIPQDPHDEDDAEPLFFLYTGAAFTAATWGLLTCWQQRNVAKVAPWNDEILVAEHMTAIWVHRSLMRHPRRTRDPALASLFFVPLWAELTNGPEGCQGKDLRKIGGDIVTELRRSYWFQRFGGSDHALISATWNTDALFSGTDLDTLARAVIGSFEAGTPAWNMWGCADRAITIPYSARSDITWKSASRRPAVRKTTFFFAGSNRGRPERLNLAAVAHAVPHCDIDCGEKAPTLSEKAHLDNSYPTRIADSRFCFCPRGDTPSSRRLFDAVAAGCIPIIQEMLRDQDDLPYANVIPYDKMAVIVPDEVFLSRENITELAVSLSKWPMERLDTLHRQLLKWRGWLAVARHSGDTFWTMRPSGTAGIAFADAALAVTRERRWSCGGYRPNSFELVTVTAKNHRSMADQTQQRADRLRNSTYPRAGSRAGAGRRDEWLARGETIVIKESSLLLCDVPGSGGGPLLAAVLALAGGAGGNAAAAAATAAAGRPGGRFGGIFGAESPWSLLAVDASDGAAAALAAAYSPQWVQMRVIRDPVVRLLALFLEFEAPAVTAAATAAAADVAATGASAAEAAAAAAAAATAAATAGTAVGNFVRKYLYSNLGSATGAGAAASFKTFAARLARQGSRSDTHPAYRAQAGFCGARYRPFAASLQHETLQRDGELLLRSLGDRNGENAGAEAVAATVGLWNQSLALRVGAAAAASHAANDLFAACGWTAFYDEATLELVAKIYAEDYATSHWYSVPNWKAEMSRCRAKDGTGRA